MVVDIWASYRRLPFWVQAWVAFLLAPLNLWSLTFVGEPAGLIVAVLAVGGMALNLPIIARDRGMSKAMSLPHLVLWTPLWIVALSTLVRGLTDRVELSSGYQWYLVLLLAVDGVSLVFDAVDGWKWFRGDRAIA